MNRLLSKDGFLRVLFETIPFIALVLDNNLMVSAINKTTSSFFNLKEGVMPPTQGGRVLHCINRYDHAQGCGHGPECANCIIRNTAIQARQGNSTQRAKGKIQIETEEDIKEMNVLVSAAPFVYEEE